MATFAQLRSEIARLINVGTTGNNNTEIDQAINDAIDFHSTRRFDFNDGFNSFPTVAGTANYDLPSDLLAITHAQLFWGGSNFTTLKKRNWSWYLRVNQDASQLRAVPSTYYAIRDQDIYLYPTPSGAFTVELYYVKQLTPSPLSADDDQNAWTNAARLLIRSRALYDLYTNKLHLADKATAALGFEQDALDLLTRRSAMNLGQQELTPMEY